MSDQIARPLQAFASGLRKPVRTFVPGSHPINLYAYYDEFASYYPYCEPQTKRWFCENVENGWTIFDVGANIGYYSILFSRLSPAGRIYAFEPTSTALKLLKNLSLNKIENVRVEPYAMGDKAGVRQDAVFRIWGEAPEQQEYLFETIDNYVDVHDVGRVDCIKIDTDSFDFEVLKGARDVIIRDNPWIVVELNHALSRRGQTDVEAFSWLESLGYCEALSLDRENYVLKRREGASAHAGFRLHFDKRPIFARSPQSLEYDATNVLSLSPKAYNGAALETVDGAWRLSANLDAYNYVLGFNFDHAILEPSLPVVVVADLSVEKGVVGVSGADSAGAICTEEISTDSSGQIELLIDKPVDKLIFRTLSQDGNELVAVIERVHVRFAEGPAIEDEIGYNVRRDDKISIDALRAAWSLAAPESDEGAVANGPDADAQTSAEDPDSAPTATADPEIEKIA